MVIALLIVAPAMAQVHTVLPTHVRTVPAQTPLALAPVRVPAAPAVPIVLPHPPPVTDVVTSTFATALLAITRAQQIDPAAAQTASFQYVAALQQYRSGNVAAARITALEALSTASQAQVRATTPAVAPTPGLVSAAPQLPGLAGGPYGGDAPAIDAASFLALARGIIDDCAARHDHRVSTARAHYAQAQNDFDLRDWEATRTDAKAAIDACAKSH
jgi:hypothetical protein